MFKNSNPISSLHLEGHNSLQHSFPRVNKIEIIRLYENQSNYSDQHCQTEIQNISTQVHKTRNLTYLIRKLKRPFDKTPARLLPEIMLCQFNGLEHLRISETRRLIHSPDLTLCRYHSNNITDFIGTMGIKLS